MQDSVGREKRSLPEGRQAEKQLDRVVSGDSETQEQFLQVCVWSHFVTLLEGCFWLKGVMRSSMGAVDGQRGDASVPEHPPAARH